MTLDGLDLDTTMIHEREALSLVVRRLAECRGKAKADITADTKLYEDLGIYGDDWDEVLEALQPTQIDWSGFDFARYFKSEWHLLSWIVWVFERMSPTKRRSFTVGHLARVVARGQWFEPPSGRE